MSIGGVKTITVQRLSVHGCDPTVLRSEGLCEALERFHCGLYPLNPPTELNGRVEGHVETNSRYDYAGRDAGAGCPIQNASLARSANLTGQPDYYTICCMIGHIEQKDNFILG